MQMLFGVAAFFAVSNVFIAEKLQTEPEEVFKTIIAIDLGTINSRVAIFKGRRVEIIANENGSRTTPSLVGFSPEGDVLIGESVKNLMITNPENTIFNSKRLMGREWTDPSLQNDLKHLPYMVTDMNGKPLIEVTTAPRVELSNPQKISAILLMEMKDIAEKYLKKKVSHAIVTVPASFNNAQRLATRQAGIMAGLNIKIVNEPSMAAIAYSFGKPHGVEKNIVVLHLGGGAFDVSIVHVSNDIIEVMSTIGNSNVGGEDFNQRVMDHLVELHKKNTGKDTSTDKIAIQKLRHEVEIAKRALSTDHEVNIEIESLYDGDDFSATLSRKKFEELNMDFFQSIMKLVEKVFEDGKLKKEDIDDIVLVGGSARIPKIRTLIKEFFNGKEPWEEMDPEETVCYGAAVSAGRMGVEEDAGRFIVLDVNPFTIGVKTTKDTMTTIFHKNQMIPAYKSFTFTTSKDNQDAITVPVFEGENNLLGVFNLTGFPLAPRGETRIKVTFEIDINGIFSVSNADDAQTGKEQITSTDDRSEPIQEDMVHLAKSAKKVAKEQMEARNELELHMYLLKKYIGDDKLGGKLSDMNKKAIESVVNEKMKWLDANPDAKAEESAQQLRKIEEIVQPIIAKLHSSRASHVQTDEDGKHPDSFRDEL